ncbi:MAG: helix-turn-helix transcriptional regulator [Chitinophagaceae bacterium]
MNIRDEKFVKAVGERLKEIRIKKSMSQEELANTAEIPTNQIGRIERGEINTTLITMKAIADALSVDVIELFQFKR